MTWQSLSLIHRESISSSEWSFRLRISLMKTSVENLTLRPGACFRCEDLQAAKLTDFSSGVDLSGLAPKLISSTPRGDSCPEGTGRGGAFRICGLIIMESKVLEVCFCNIWNASSCLFRDFCVWYREWTLVLCFTGVPKAEKLPKTASAFDSYSKFFWQVRYRNARTFSTGSASENFTNGLKSEQPSTPLHQKCIA